MDTFDNLYNLIVSGSFVQRNTAIIDLRNYLLKETSLYMKKKDNLLTLFDIILAEHPNTWQLINQLIIVISKYSPKPEEMDIYLAFIIEVSYRITLAFFMSGKPNATPPDMRRINEFIEKHAIITKNTIFVFAKHCTLGFIHKSSFLDYFIPHIKDVTDYVTECDYKEYDKLLEPLSSSDRKVQVFFLIVWVDAMNTLYKSFFARHALVTCSQSLFALNEDPYTSSGSTYLLELTKSSPVQFKELLNFSPRLSKGLIQVLNKLSADAVEPVDQTSQNIVIKKQKESIVQRAKAMIYQSKVFHSAWEPISITLIVEARVIMWGITETQMKQGKAIGFSEIKSVSITDSQKKGVMNVLIIKANAKEEYKIAFESQNIASQWANVIQAQRPQ